MVFKHSFGFFGTFVNVLRPENKLLGNYENWAPKWLYRKVLSLSMQISITCVSRCFIASLTSVTMCLCMCSAPCVPQNLLPIIDCSSDSVSLTWNMANGALFYIASVTDSSGRAYTCSTTDLNCQIRGLRCGTSYNASIISSNYKCNSSLSDKITVETGKLMIRVHLFNLFTSGHPPVFWVQVLLHIL